MVEQEHSQAAAIFPTSLNTNTNIQNMLSYPWFVTDSNALIKVDLQHSSVKTEPLCSPVSATAETVCNPTSVNPEPFFNSVEMKEETLCSPVLNATPEERSSFGFQGAASEDITPVKELELNDHYSDMTKCNIEKNWQPFSEMFSSVSDPYFEANSPLSFWGSCPLDLDTMKMDDVFQVDKDDLVQSPTLAELNANDESLFDSFDNFDVFLPSEHKSNKSSSSSVSDLQYANPIFKISSLSNAEQLKLSNECVISEKPCEIPHSDTSYEKCIAPTEVKSESSHYEVKLQTVPSLITDNPKKQINAGSPAVSKPIKKSQCIEDSSNFDCMDEQSTEAVSQLSLSSTHDIYDSEEEDSEMDCDCSTDAEESEEDEKPISSKHVASNSLIRSKKKSRYFWQYNIQAKGPKAPKIKLAGKCNIIDDFSGVADPVFSSDCALEGVKHAGKARRGDGNDLTPNPKKLYTIGLELEKLTSVIDGLIPVNELPLNARSKSRKEKNKLASRACRLKKKAQHEANKLKLFGLQQEQKHLLKLMSQVKKLIKKRIEKFKHNNDQSLQAAIESLTLKKTVTKVAGCSADFVNNVLKNVGSGDDSGGLNIAVNDES